jgi:hypothetical protein
VDAEENDQPKDTNSVYIWRSEGPDGTQAVMVAPLGKTGILFSLVFPDETAARKLTPFVRSVVEDRKTPAELVRFDLGETIAEVAPDLQGARSPGPEDLAGQA